MNTIQEELVKGRSLLLLDHCFWGVLALRLKLIEEMCCETACTNGEWIRYNPEYIETLAQEECIGLLAHEVMHPAMGDIWRGEGRDHQLWNAACDYVNNLILIEAGLTLPEGALVNYAYAGKCKEEVYQLLMQQPKSKKKTGKYSDPGKCGSFVAPSPKNKKEARQAKQAQVEWRNAVIGAAHVARGDIPGSLRRLIDEMLEPQMPWYALLRDFVQRTARNDYNWNRPNRRYLQRGIVLPSLISDELPKVVLILDTSQSTQQYWKQFASEASGILSGFQTTVQVLYADASVQGEDFFESDDLPLTVRHFRGMGGGGGTDFRPAFEHLEKTGSSPTCAVYLTDLEGTFPSDPPDYPVLWVSTTEHVAPWGETVRFNP
jgi:predicted metal-dependent peptidase